MRFGPNCWGFTFVLVALNTLLLSSILMNVIFEQCDRGVDTVAYHGDQATNITLDHDICLATRKRDEDQQIVCKSYLSTSRLQKKLLRCKLQ